MINCEKLYNLFSQSGLDFFTGVPDSTFKDWMKFLADEHEERLTNIIACNECEAVAVASGYHLATGKVGVVYMQNSGLGKTVNPLTSLCDPEVYSIPVLLMVGWRGEPGLKDEPQHKKMGRVTLSLLNTLEIPYKMLPDNAEEAGEVILEMKKLALENKTPVAIVIKKGTLEEYEAPPTLKLRRAGEKKVKTDYEMSREDAVKKIVDELDATDVVVSTTGKISRELFEYRDKLGQSHGQDFLTVGSMGCSASIANGIALQKPEKKIFVFDGDGAVLMQMGMLATIGYYKPKNFYHIIFDNGAYDSTGGQPTISSTVDFGKIALACGYKDSRIVETRADLESAIRGMRLAEGPQMLIVKVNKGARKDLGRPTTTPIENKEAFMGLL